MTIIPIYRNSEVVALIKPTETSSQTKKVMGDNIVTLSFELGSMVNFSIGDYATIYDEIYYINTIPNVKKKSLYNYEYDAVLQSSLYTLSKAQYLFLGDDNSYKTIDFALVGNPDTFIDLMITNLNRIDPGWQKGGIVQDDYKNLTFSQTNCFDALKQIAEAFGTEYYVEGKRIHLAKQVKQTPYTFKYGDNKGLYDIARTPLQGTSIITRLYAFGGTTNIPNDYRNYSQRLLLPNVASENTISNLTAKVFKLLGNVSYAFKFDLPLRDDVTNIVIYYRVAVSGDWESYGAGINRNIVLRLPASASGYEFYFSSITEDATFDTEPVFINGNIFTPLFATATNYYLERNTDKYGIIEGTLLLDDIYPNRVGKVTSVDATNVYKFKDAGIDFDVNEYLLPGLTAKLTFNTGQLTGYTFDISKFDNETKEFTILKNKDEKALDVPSIGLSAAIGDEYVLTDIRLPQSYIDNAELALYQKTVENLEKNSVPQFNYIINPDISYFRDKKIKLGIGDLVILSDIELQVEKQLRVISLSRSLINEYEYSNIELGELPPPNRIAQLQTNLSNAQSLIRRLSGLFAGNALLSGTNIGNLTIQQGGLNLPDIPTLPQAGLTPVFLDANNNIVRGGG